MYIVKVEKWNGSKFVYIGSLVAADYGEASDLSSLLTDIGSPYAVTLIN